MRRMITAVSVLTLVTWLAPSVSAQETKSARGSVTAMAGNSLTVKAGDREMKFTIDAKTHVTAEGGSTASRQAAAKGETGPKLADVLKVGDAVEVSYHEMGGTLHAAEVRKVRTPGAGGGGTSDQRAATKSDSASGTVESVTNNLLTITGAGGGGSTFKQSYVLDASTRVVGSGVGTAAAKAGGKVSFTDHVGKGDRVTVTYRATGTTLHAEEVRITQKAAK
jgi:hypothetical protein